MNNIVIIQKEKSAIRKLRMGETFLFKGFTKDRLVKIIKEESLPFQLVELEGKVTMAKNVGDML